MSYTKSNLSKTLTNIITYLLFAVLALGLISGILYLVNRTDGIYIVYGDTKITESNDGITIEWTSDEITFQINNTDDWGAYSVQDCTVKIIPNVSDAKDFEYTVDGESGAGKFSLEDDLTAGFIEDYSSYDGNGLVVSSDGEFTLSMIEYTSDYLENAMPEILSRVYSGSVVTLGSEIDILSYPYFSIQVTSPDGDTVIAIPFSLYINEYYIYYDLEGATASVENVASVTTSDSATLRFTAASGYVLPDEITVTGATLDSWNSSTGVAVISNATGRVTVIVVSLHNYNINYNLSNVLADEDNAVSIIENETIHLSFSSVDGYGIPAEITVTNASYSWSYQFEDTGSLYLWNATGDVTITICGVADDTYTLSGVWVFSETLVGDASGSGWYSVDFTSNGTSYNDITFSVNLGTNMLIIDYGNDEVFVQGSGWVDTAYMTIDFGEDGQSVSAALYGFITKYATQQ